MNNRLIIVGRAGKDPEKIEFPSGKSLVKLSVAVKEFSATGEDEALWIDVEAWNGIGENVLKTVTKGREGVFQGRLGENTYTDKATGNSVTKPVLKLLSFTLTGSKPAAAEPVAKLVARSIKAEA